MLTRRSLLAALASIPVLGRLVGCKAEDDAFREEYPRTPEEAFLDTRDPKAIVTALWKAEQDIWAETGAPPTGYCLTQGNWLGYHREVFDLHHQFLPVTYEPPRFRTRLEYGGVPVHWTGPHHIYRVNPTFTPEVWGSHVTAFAPRGSGYCSTLVPIH